MGHAAEYLIITACARLNMCISPLMFKCILYHFPAGLWAATSIRFHPHYNHNLRILFVSVIMLLRHCPNLLVLNQAFCVHHPQNNPITNAYILHPYVATMFRNIRRLGDMGNAANIKLLPVPIINEQLSCHDYLRTARFSSTLCALFRQPPHQLPSNCALPRGST